MVRQGYNVLALDANGHLSDDPYAYLKAPPLQTAQLVTMTHGGWAGMTAGLVYVHGAAATGPAAWALAEVVRRVRSTSATWRALLPLCWRATLPSISIACFLASLLGL